MVLAFAWVLFGCVCAGSYEFGWWLVLLAFGGFGVYTVVRVWCFALFRFWRHLRGSDVSVFVSALSVGFGLSGGLVHIVAGCGFYWLGFCDAYVNFWLFWAGGLVVVVFCAACGWLWVVVVEFAWCWCLCISVCWWFEFGVAFSLVWVVLGGFVVWVAWLILALVVFCCLVMVVV